MAPSSSRELLISLKLPSSYKLTNRPLKGCELVCVGDHRAGRVAELVRVTVKPLCEDCARTLAI